MSKERDAELAALLKAAFADEGADEVEEPEPEPEVGEFGLRLSAALKAAIAHMRAAGIIEVEDGAMEGLTAEVTEAGLDAKSPKQLISRVIKTLLESELVEEVYGTDEAISRTLRELLGGD